VRSDAIGTSRHFAALQHSGRYWSNSGHWAALARNDSVAIDPTATLAVHCGNGFDAIEVLV